jgi:spore coat protein U-like protein
MPSAAKADTATSALVVSATVLKACVATVGVMAFGNYSATNSSPNDATATLAVICTPGTSYDIALDAGLGTGATTTTRKMGLLTNTVNYQLFRDASRSQNWGNTGGTDTVSGSGSGLISNHTIYGRISTGQYVGIGAYVDTVTITVTY